MGVYLFVSVNFVVIIVIALVDSIRVLNNFCQQVCQDQSSNSFVYPLPGIL